MRYHFTHYRMIKLKRLIIPTISEDMEKLEPSYTAGGNVNGTTTLENIGSFLKS